MCMNAETWCQLFKHNYNYYTKPYIHSNIHSDIIMPSSGVVQACSDVVMISLTLWLARVH